MITYAGDVRNPPNSTQKITAALDSLTGNSLVAALLVNNNDKILFTTTDPNGASLAITGITPAALLESPAPYGPGLVYRDVDVGVDQTAIDQWLLVSQAVANSGGAVNTFGPSDQPVSLTRILFHELSHLAFGWQDSLQGIGFEEELSVFAENTIYRKIATSLGQNDQVIRYGHYSHQDVAWNGVGVSGVGSFEAYIQSPSATITLDQSRTDANKATFVAQDATYTLTKTFWNAGHEVDYFFYDHYVTLTEEKASGSYITAGSQPGYVMDQRVDQVVGDLMHNNVSGGLYNAVTAWKAVSTLAGSHSLSVSRITGLGADATALTKTSGSGANVVETPMIYAGVAETGQTSRPAAIAIDDSTSTQSTLLIGAAGYNVSSGGSDDLRAGAGNDIVLASGFGGNDVFGNGGHDILVGTSGFDHIYGGTGDDIIIGGAGQNYLDGGDDVDTAYYGDRPQGIVVYDGLNRVDHDGLIDVTLNFERYFGTTQRDTFVGDGKGHVFVGNGGDDRFLAATNPDTFIGTGTQTARTDQVSFEALPGFININVTAGTTAQGHSFGYVANITGTSQGDTFTVSGPTGPVTLYGGAGNDTFNVGSQAMVYGGDNDDIINLNAANFSYINGGNNNDTVNYIGFTSGVTFNTNSFYSIETFNTTGYADVITADTLATMTFNTGAGNDIIYANQGVSIINGGADFDTVSYANTSLAITIATTGAGGGAAGDVFINVEKIIGTIGADVFKGGVAQFWGGAGDDVFFPGNGGYFNGEGGIDAIDFSLYPGAINFNLGSTSLSTGETFTKFERVNGTAFNDILTGTSANEDFFGGTGSDTVTGGGGMDRYFLDADKVGGDGDPDVMRVRKISDGGSAFHYDVDITYNGGASYQTDHLYGISSMVLPDGSSFAFPASAWYNPFYS